MNIKLTNSQKIKILCSDDIYSIMQKILLRENKIDRNREHFWTISLDNAHKILNIELVSMGSATKTVVEPMEVFSIPLQKRAVRIILVHNHPSGEIKPSKEDLDITDRLIQAGRILQTPVLDHLIITEKTFFSFEDVGLIKELEQSTKYVTAYELKRRYQKEALEKGNIEGKKEKAIEMAKAMKEEGIAIEIIAKISGLSPNTIKRLKTK
ncbi:helix-turn-helix domain-containing protein [Fulvivirga sp. M361]|uniref:JAB domain-containing protein n=1 Tax=Fulvivirga sp. M361 TaxID=2594266 RepID=UPI00117B93C8|nr:JAB domain-containing protein [Fulvivirga sp. M361]TRX46295.1 helix-turn-helix domain-containing protein [Fulvivirga sp. M361]